MIGFEFIAHKVKSLRPTAKFVVVNHSSNFIDASAELGDGFYTANLYDEQINANLIRFNESYVLIENTYISSFAYNLFLCWQFGLKNQNSDHLLALNLKKFVAEQLYRRVNVVPSRALLLESLVFESQHMIPVFAAVDTDEELRQFANQGQAIMPLLLSIHELGHYYFSTRPNTWDDLMRGNENVLGPVSKQAESSLDDSDLVEFRCDAFAILSVINQFEKSYGLKVTVRAILFAYASYAAMYSGVLTADLTGAVWESDFGGPVDLLDISPGKHIDYPVKFDLDRQFIDRSVLMTSLCLRIAQEAGFEAFGDDEPFPMPVNIIERMCNLVLQVFDGDRDNARIMSNLLAKSLDRHPEGMEYLYLRSKVFKSNRTEPLVL